MILTTLEKLKKRVNAPNIGAIDARCGALLGAATLHVAAYLRTDFTRESGVSNTFTLRRADYRARTHLMRLELSNNLVDASEVVCNAASSKYNLKRDISSVVDELDYEIDATNGIVLLPEWQACGQVVEVVYTKGLNTADDGNGYDLAQNVPDWLEEAALVTAAYYYLLPNIESTDDMCHGLPCEAKQLLSPYLRGRQDAYQAE